MNPTASHEAGTPPAMNAEVKCLFTEIWPLEKFVENPRNPNRHPEGQIVLLADIIKTRGWRSPIVVSAQSGFVVKGHGRLAAARRAGLAEAPVEIQSYATPAEEHADLIADNRIAELAEIDTHALRGLMEELSGEIDLRMAGFTEVEWQNLQLAAPRNEDDQETIQGGEGESTTGRSGTFLRFGKHNFPLTEEEYAELVKRADAHRESQGTSYGFVRNLLGMQ